MSKFGLGPSCAWTSRREPETFGCVPRAGRSSTATTSGGTTGGTRRCAATQSLRRCASSPVSWRRIRRPAEELPAEVHAAREHGRVGGNHRPTPRSERGGPNARPGSRTRRRGTRRRVDARGEGIAVPRLGLLAHTRHRAARHTRRDGLRRSARPAQAARREGPCRAGRQPPGHLLPHRVRPGLVLGRGPPVVGG